MQWWKDFFVGVGFVLAVMIGIMIFMIIPIISILYGHPLWGGVFAILSILAFVGVLNAQEQKQNRKRQQKEK
jgi:membrane protein implicated in regulation of membrane protease activity